MCSAISSVKRVLIIDGDTEFAAETQEILERDSISVTRATCCAEGMLAAESEPPDAIVLEAMLPNGTEGFHFVWNLRQHRDQRLRDVPVIIVSHINGTIPFRVSPSDSDWEYGPGEFLPAQCFLDKPVEPEELLEQVRGVLGRG